MMLIIVYSDTYKSRIELFIKLFIKRAS